jgi:hypothetical protein
LIRPGKSRTGGRRPRHASADASQSTIPGIGSSTFPMRQGWFTPGAHMVSVLDLDRHAPCRHPGGCRRMPPHAGTSARD